MDIVTSIPLLSFTFSNLQGRTTTYNNMSTTSMPVRIKYSYNYQLASEYPNPLPPGTVRLEQITDI